MDAPDSAESISGANTMSDSTISLSFCRSSGGDVHIEVEPITSVAQIRVKLAAMVSVPIACVGLAMDGKPLHSSCTAAELAELCPVVELVMLQTFPAKTLEDIYGLVDRDGDGLIDWEELKESTGDLFDDPIMKDVFNTGKLVGKYGIRCKAMISWDGFLNLMKDDLEEEWEICLAQRFKSLVADLRSVPIVLSRVSGDEIRFDVEPTANVGKIRVRAANALCAPLACVCIALDGKPLDSTIKASDLSALQCSGSMISVVKLQTPDLETLTKMFASMDKTGEGLGSAELRENTGDLLDDPQMRRSVQQMISDYDEEGTGTITLDGFLELMRDDRKKDEEIRMAQALKSHAANF